MGQCQHFSQTHVPHFHGSLVVAHEILDRFDARFTKANKHKNVVSFHKQQLSDLKLFCGAFLEKRSLCLTYPEPVLADWFLHWKSSSSNIVRFNF